MKNKIEKELVIQKIDLEQNKNIKQTINRAFSDPSYYFSDTLNGYKIIIGKKKPPKNKITRNNLTRKSIIYYKNKGNLIKIATDKKKDLSFLKSKENSSNEKRKYLDDEDLEEIYSKYEENIENTIKLNKEKLRENRNQKFLKDELINDIDNKLYRTVKTELGYKLNFQEEVLNTKKNEENIIKNIKYNLLKKLKRPENELLMTYSENYRIKKEIKENVSQKIKKTFPQPLYKWIVSLRGDKENHYINDGTDENPLWNVYIHKKHTKQKIRNSNLFRTNTEFFKNNDYIKKKLKIKNFNKLNKEIDNINSDFSNMLIKGKNLLNFEKENTRNLKGRKYIVLNNPFIHTTNAILNAVTLVSDKNLKNEIYKRNFNPREIVGRKGRSISHFY